MLNQRKCPCCVGGQEPEYRQNIQRSVQKYRKAQRVEQQQEYLSEASERKPYAYLGEGEIWANGAFMKILQKKYAASGVHHHCHHSPCPSPNRCCRKPAKASNSPAVFRRSVSPRRCSPIIKVVSPMRSTSPTRRRSPSPKRGKAKSPNKISCTYRVCPVKSRSEIRDGDLIIETNNHKFLKVLGADEYSSGDDFYVLVDMGTKSRGRTRGRSSSSSSSSSSSDEEMYTPHPAIRCSCHKCRNEISATSN
ncbi:hypothetical protein Aperf_G00000019434 [Anoplocephala perfoliata]